MIQKSCRLAWIGLILCFAFGLAAQTSSPKQNPAPQRGKAAATAKKKEPTPAVANPLDAFTQFSAVLNGGLGMQDRQIHRSGNLFRADYEDSYRVTDLKKNVTWAVHPNHCAQFPVSDASTYPFSAYHDFKLERSMTDQKETVDGHPCKIEDLTFTPKNQMPIVIKMKLWEAEDLEGFPVKIEVESGPGHKTVLNYTQVQIGPQDAKLFAHPARCGPGAQQGQKGTVKVVPQSPKP